MDEDVVGTFALPFRFTGEQTDANDQIYLRARYYNPALGVFPSLDPLETLNRYSYVNGNPINYVDPRGLFCEAAAVACGAAIVSPFDLVFGDIAACTTAIGCMGIAGVLAYIAGQANPSDFSLPALIQSTGGQTTAPLSPIDYVPYNFVDPALTAEQNISSYVQASCGNLPPGSQRASCQANIYTQLGVPVTQNGSIVTPHFSSLSAYDQCLLFNSGLCEPNLSLIPPAANTSYGLYNASGLVSEYRLSGFGSKVGTLAEHLAKLLERDVAGYQPSPDTNPYRDPDRGWCTTIKNKITEIRNARYSEAQLSRDLNSAGFSDSKWTEITGAIAEVVASGLCDDHWPDDFNAGGPLATA